MSPAQDRKPRVNRCSFRYERSGVVLRIQTRDLTNHELRNILIGFWLTLDDDDRGDHIKELSAYLEPGSWPPPVSAQIAKAVIEARDPPV